MRLALRLFFRGESGREIGCVPLLGVDARAS
jgi:hypothetical protein